MGLAPEEIDNQMAVVVGLQTAAADGDARAAALLAKILGEDQPRASADEAALTRAAQLLGGIDSVID